MCLITCTAGDSIKKSDRDTRQGYQTRTSEDGANKEPWKTLRKKGTLGDAGGCWRVKEGIALGQEERQISSACQDAFTRKGNTRWVSIFRRSL